jgi:superfamily I DNA/RNA helicase
MQSPRLRAILNELNEAQLAAVTADERVILVLAGAGSGKTRVISARVAWHLAHGTRPARLAAVTFTNKAAREMKERIAQTVEEMPFIGTFHRLGLEVLRRHGRRVGLPARPTIVDRADQAGLLREAMREVGLQPSAWDLHDARELLLEGRTARATEGRVRFRRPHGLAPVAADMLRSYEARLRALGSVDFDDLILLPLRLLNEEPRAAADMRERVSVLLVDEFQDTNPAQLALIRALVGERGALTAVGDDDQSIYGFRGARVEHMLRFADDFDGARTLRLEENYRSVPVVLSLANRIIGGNAERLGKVLRPVLAEGGSVRLLGLADEESEAGHVAAEIGRAMDAGVDPGDVAVLYRTNQQASQFEVALGAAGIPFQKVGGRTLLDTKEVRDAIAWLALMVDPDDDASFRRAVLSPPRGVGPATLMRLAERARRARCSLHTAAKHLRATDPDLPAGAFSGLSVMREAVASARAAVKSLGTAGSFRALLDKIAFRAYLLRQCDTPAEGSRRYGHVLSLTRLLEGYLARDPVRGAQDFIDEVLLTSPNDPVEEAPAPKVTLMTLHGAKGLEFDVVFLTGVEEGLLPHERSLGDPGGLSEERRLLYVGVTRARRHLVLSYARRRGSGGPTGEHRLSRFLRDVGLRPRVVSAGAALSPAKKPAPEGLAKLRELLD